MYSTATVGYSWPRTVGRQLGSDHVHINKMTRFRSITKSYFRRCDGVILVYDSTYERSFLNVREWIDTINESAPKKVSIMIIANKIDLRDQVRSEGKRVIEHDDGARLAKVRLA